jgi:ethanolamine utilization protein EutQ (cupin superfamily)
MSKPVLIDRPTRIAPAGNKPKIIDEYVGRVNTGSDAVSIARMQSPEGWTEPGQRPDFDEFTVVIRGRVHVEYEGGRLQVNAGQAILTPKGTWIRYSTPDAEGAEYFAICLPAFSPESVHRDND